MKKLTAYVSGKVQEAGYRVLWTYVVLIKPTSSAAFMKADGFPKENDEICAGFREARS